MWPRQQLAAEHLFEVELQVGGLDLAKVLIRVAVVPGQRVLLRLGDGAGRALLGLGSGLGLG